MFGVFGFPPVGGVVPPAWVLHHMKVQKEGAKMMAAALAAGAFLVSRALLPDELQPDEDPAVHACVDGKLVKSYVVIQ